MWRIVGVFAILALGHGARAETPAERYRNLEKRQELAAAPGRVLTDAERLVFIGQTFRRWNAIALEFIDLAEKHPNDPIAVDALIRAAWQVNSTPWPVELVGRDEASAKALAILQRDHVRSNELGPLCERLASGFREEYETFLRSVARENPNREVKARARLALAHLLVNRLRRIDLIRDQPGLEREFAGLFGAEYLAALRARDRGEVTREAEDLLERVRKDEGDVKPPGGASIADRAEAELFEIRHLSVGKQAPDIEGDDQDGKRFALSDYRGKVVLLDFWSEY